MKYPSLKEEKKLWKEGYKSVACLDEAGRGPLAGPVVAAAAMIKDLSCKIRISCINDSKKLSAKKRQEFYRVLTVHPGIAWGMGKVSERMIDKINILEATKLAMEKALKGLNRKLKTANRKIDFLILDGNFKIDSPISQKSIVKADEKVFSCAVASIIAKVTRDRIMERYHKKYPQYGFDRHKGYLTKLHRLLLKRHGCCKIHRKTFRPLKKNN